MGGNATNLKKSWINSYSDMTMGQAEERLGFRIRSLEAVSVDSMLANTKHSLGAEYVDIMLKTKERVYDNIVEYLVIEGYPTEGDPDFEEGNVNDLVYGIISPILGSFIRMTGRKSIQLRRMDVIFGAIAQEKEKWMKSYSAPVDCMYAALSNGGMMKDIVVG